MNEKSSVLDEKKKRRIIFMILAFFAILGFGSYFLVKILSQFW